MNAFGVSLSHSQLLISYSYSRIVVPAQGIPGATHKFSYHTGRKASILLFFSVHFIFLFISREIIKIIPLCNSTVKDLIL